MNFKTHFVVVVTILMIISPPVIKANDDIKPNEITIRNQLISDVYLLKEGVDSLLINTEILNKRFTSQVEILKTVQSKLLTESTEAEDNSCECITGLFNSTFRKINVLENHLALKLEDMQDEQATRLNEILAKQKQNKNCDSKPSSPSSELEEVTLLLANVSKKIQIFEQKFAQLEKLEEKLSAQQNTLNQFVESQTTILQQINDKLAKNQELLGKYENEFSKINDLKSELMTAQRRSRPKLPMEVILGLTSSNITNLK